MRLLYISLFICMLVVQLDSQAQDTIRKTVYFNSASTNPLPPDLHDVYQTIRDINYNYDRQVILEGHTDNTGSPEKNRQLSEQRAAAVSLLLQQNFKLINIASVTGKGDTKPVADNATETGKSRNRRVDILIIVKQRHLPGSGPENNIELYKKLALTPQEFCVKPDEDQTIRCKGGTVLHVKAGSFNTTGSSCIKIRVKEVFTLSDMILENLTTTSNGQPLESQGMIYTEAVDAMGKPLQLLPGRDIIIMVPADTIRADAGIFKGNRDSTGQIDWETDDSALLSSFKLANLNFCGRRFCGGVISPPDCKPCAFLFCRVGRLHKVIGAVFSGRQRSRNRQFNICQDLLKQWNDSTSALQQRLRNRQQNNATPAVPGEDCHLLDSLFRKYGVKDYRGLMEAMNKPLLEKYKVSSIEALEDTLRKVKIADIELAYQRKTLSLEDYNYYMFNTNRMGWINVDCFSDMKNRHLTAMDIVVTNSGAKDCRLVFKQRNAVLSTKIRVDNRFVFDGIPKRELVWMLAIGTKNGEPLLGMQEVTVDNGTHQLTMEALDLATFKERLQLLNR